MPSTANIKRADTTTGTVHLDVGADKVGGDTSASESDGDMEHIVEPVTMPSAANNKRATTTTGTVNLAVEADKVGGDTSANEMDGDTEHRAQSTCYYA